MRKNSKILTMIEALSSQNSSINVHNTESFINRLYHMDVPFQLTMECCSGSNLEDYINIVTLSSERAILYQESAGIKNNYAQAKDVLHFHDYFEFVIVLEGSIIQKIEEKEYLYPAGTCCLLNRSLCHLEHYHSKSKVLFIGMSPDFILDLFLSAQNSSFQNEKKICESALYHFIMEDLKNPDKKKAYIDFTPPSCQNDQNVEYLHSLAESMIQLLLYPDFGASYQIRGLFCTFLSYLSSPQYYHSKEVKLDTGSDFLIFSRISHLFEENDGRMTRPELEQLLNYSGDYLNRIVNKYAGMCLFDYGMTFCLKKAAWYLTETNDSISAIAAKLQFSNRTHFYHLFKEKYGVTPKEYRQSHI